MNKDYPSIGSSHIVQPRDPGVMTDADQARLRAEMFESRKFPSYFEDKVRDEINADQLVMIAYYIRARRSAIRKQDMEQVRSYNASLASYVDEVFGPHVNATLDWMIEENMGDA